MSPRSLPAALPWRQRLSTQLSAGVLLVLCLALIIAGCLIGRSEAQRFREQNAEHAARTAALVARTLSTRMLAGGGATVWKDVTALSEEFRQATGALRVQVLSRSGLIKASTEPDGVGHRYSMQNDAECRDCHASTPPGAFPAVVELQGARKALRVISPIPKQPGCARCHTEPEAFRGMIAIDFDYGPVMQAAAERNRLLLLIAISAAVAMFTLIAWLFRRLVHRPVSLLTAAADALSAGDYAARAPQVREDELGRLTGGFNRMADQIEQQIAALELNNMELNLLYTLVVEVSRSMEVLQVQSTVLHILRERLALQNIAFCVEQDDGWCCVAVGASGQEMRVRGTESMQECLAGQAAACDAGFPAVAPTLIDRACAERTVAREAVAGAWHFVIPFYAGSRLIGLLSGTYRDAGRRLDGELLANLAVHVGLALENARNFTQAITDGLTGFRTKRYGLTRLEEAIYKADRYATPLALLMCDIDHFKRINDTYGHPSGDAVLREVTRRLVQRARKSDILVRYGGEEFMAILPNIEPDGLTAIAEAFRTCVAEQEIRLEAHGMSIPVTLSVGAALFRRGSDDLDSLLGRADQALYAAKHGGRNRAIVATEG